MREIENCVEVRVSGPQDQMKIYLDWIQKSGEYRYSTGVEESDTHSLFFLTPSIQEHQFWRFSSSNLKRKIRLYQRLNKNVLKYRVNYIVYYGTHHITDDIEFHLDEKNYEQAILPELVRAFNPRPAAIANLCPDLVITTNWGSYYIEKDYQRDEFDGDEAI